MPVNPNINYFDLEALLQKHFKPELEARLKRGQLLIHSITGHLKNLSSGEESMDQSIQSIRALLNQEKDNENSLSLENEFLGGFSSIRHWIFGLDTKLVIEQPIERYNSQPNDSWVIKLAKGLKRLSLATRHTIVKSFNFFRKTKKPLHRDKQTIPVRDLLSHYFLYRFQRDFEYPVRESNKLLHESLNGLQNILQQFHTGEELALIDKLHEFLVLTDDQYNRLSAQLYTFISQRLNALWRLFEQAYEITGTIELNASYFDSSLADRRRAAMNRSFRNRNHAWIKGMNILSDRLLLSCSIDLYSKIASDSLATFTKGLDTKLSQGLKKQVDRIADFVKEHETRIQACNSSTADIYKLVKILRVETKEKFLKETVPAATKELLAENLPSLSLQLMRCYVEITEFIPQSSSYSTHLVAGNLETYHTQDFFNPKDIFDYRFRDHFIKTCDKIKLEFLMLNSQVQNAFADIGNIAQYNLESSLSVIEKDQHIPAFIIDLLNDGFVRVNARIAEVYQLIDNCKADVTNEVTVLFEPFSSQRTPFDNVEQIASLKLETLRAKGMHKTLAIWTNTVNWLNHTEKVLKLYGKNLFGKISRLYKKTEITLRFEDDQEKISTRISNYLSESRERINQLPFIYQLLFSDEPLNDENFFQARTEEMKSLKNSFEAWKTGKTASVLLYGIKGAGANTLLNFFKKTLPVDIVITEISYEGTIDSEAELIACLRESFGYNDFDTIDQLVHWLKQHPAKRIVFVDKLQKFFLRKIDGFSAMKQIFELISQTGQHVMWIASITLHAYDYLNKTIRIEDYFTKLIKLKQLTDRELEIAISKRHSVSGYKLIFNSPEKKMKRRFLKLDTKKQQDTFRTQYFHELSKSVEGSLSLAILHWILSIEKIENNTVYIENHPMQADFLKSLQAEKIFMLYALLLHDGLTEAQLSMVEFLSVGATSLYLNSMVKDGIVIEKSKQFTVNPLLYWHIHKILGTKNILH